MRVTVLSGGIGGARFLSGLRRVLDPSDPITVIGNTGDDVWLFGLRVCPDLDTVMYTLGGGIDPDKGWGRDSESWRAKEELGAYGAGPVWFGLGDRDLGTHLARTHLLREGHPLSEVTRILCARWQPGVRLLPMTDEPVETHVEIDDPETGLRRWVHFQEYWVRLQGPVAHGVRFDGIEVATAGPGVLQAIVEADLVVVPPSNPVVSVGTILSVAGVADAIRTARAPVVGVSPIVSGAPVRGMADRLLPLVDVPVTAAGVGEHYGSRTRGGLLDGWLVDASDAGCVAELVSIGLPTRAVPLLMTDPAATDEIARAVLAMADAVGGR